MVALTTQTAVGVREDLADTLDIVYADKHPALMKCAKITAYSDTHDWQVQDTGTGDATNAAEEGADAVFGALTPTEKLTNHTQIFSKTGKISGTMKRVRTAGREDELRYQKMIAGLKIRNDIEASITSSAVKVDGNTRTSGGLGSFVRQFDASADQTGHDYNGNGTNTPDLTGAARNITVDMIDDVLQAIDEKGGSPDCLLVHSKQRRKVSALQGDSKVAATRFNTGSGEQSQITRGVSLYVSDFGNLDIVTDPHMPNDRAYILETQHLQLAIQEGANFTVSDLDKTGDNEKFQVLTECTLVVRSPQTQGAVYNLS